MTGSATPGTFPVHDLLRRYRRLDALGSDVVDDHTCTDPLVHQAHDLLLEDRGRDGGSFDLGLRAACPGRLKTLVAQQGGVGLLQAIADLFVVVLRAERTAPSLRLSGDGSLPEKLTGLVLEPESDACLRDVEVSLRHEKPEHLAGKNQAAAVLQADVPLHQALPQRAGHKLGDVGLGSHLNGICFVFEVLTDEGSVAAPAILNRQESDTRQRQGRIHLGSCRRDVLLGNELQLDRERFAFWLGPRRGEPMANPSANKPKCDFFMMFTSDVPIEILASRPAVASERDRDGCSRSRRTARVRASGEGAGERMPGLRRGGR